MNYQIVPFKDNDLTLDVRVDIINKTIWLSIPEIAILFAKSRTTISKKIKAIYDQNILKKEGTCAKNAHMPQDLFRSYEETIYNLNLIKEIGILMKSNKGLLLEQFLLDYLSNLQIKNDGTIIIYNNGSVSLDVTVSPEENTVWIAKENLVDLFETTRQNIDYHITKIYEQNELAFGATCKEILQVQIEGGREVNRLTQLYNLDMVISLGYRINTKKGIEFRRWATNVLKKYLLNGYAIDEQRVLSVRNIVKLENDVNELKEKVDDIIYMSQSLIDNKKHLLNNSIRKNNKMNKEELIRTLIAADEDIFLIYPNAKPIDVVIGGGSVLIIQGLIGRQTPDIDTLGMYGELEDVFNKHNINSRMNTFIDSLAECYEDRLTPLSLNTKVLNYKMLSIEDLILMKLYSDREKDYRDIAEPNVINSINWDLLDQIVNDGELNNSFNESRYQRFLQKFEEYKKKYKKQ